MRASSKKVTPKKRGRPATGKDPARTFRLSDEFIGKVDTWAASQDDEPGRSEAIRRLVEIGLKATPKIRPVERALAHAAELAAKALNEHTPRRRRRAKD